MAKLTLEDISDLRAYEREREEFRTHVIALKKRRRVHVGPVVTLVFENRDTIRFQIQEMARVEKLISDEAIETELAIYNPLIPDPGSLAATLFIELTSEDELREWLPRLVGIERQVALAFGGETVACVPEAEHGAALTRETVTPAVHYLRFPFTEAQVSAFEAAGEVALVSLHPAYEARAVLPPPVKAELRHDLRGTTKVLPIG